MYKNLNEMVTVSGISKSEMLYHINRGDVAWCGSGPRNENIVVDEDDVLNLMIEKEKIMG